MSTLLQDLRFGLRMLAKKPGFTAVAVLTLALAIGGTTAIFSVVYGAVLNPFPYRDIERLVVFVSHDIKQGRDAGWAWVSASELLDYQEQNRVFDEVIGGTGEDVVLTGGETPQYFYGISVTGNLFRVLGVPPLIGRHITPEDCRAGAPPVAVLSYKAWRSSLGGDPGILGRRLILNHEPTTVVGVMPPRFGWQGGEVWLPGSLSRGGATERPHYFCVVGHLKPGVSVEQANADVTVLAKRLATVYAKDHPAEMTVRAEALADAAVGDIRKAHYIFLGAVGFLLLIACVNVASLLLARATAREREIAIRTSLGASRGRLVRQFMIESLLLALGGALLGCLVAWNGLESLVAVLPPSMMPSEAVVRMNVSVLLFTVGVAILASFAFGLVPAVLAVTRDLQAPLKASARTAGESQGHHRVRNLLVVSEVGLSLVLLAGAGLLIRSFFELRHLDLGYSPENVLRVGAGLPEERYKTVEQRNDFHLESLRRVRAVPGVISAALAAPAMNWAFSAPIEIAGKPSAEPESVRLRFASDGFFETMRIRLLRGRSISDDDVVRARRVAVVSRTFVTTYFGHDNPLGRQIKVKEGGGMFLPWNREWVEIIGEVADTRYSDGGPPDARPTIFLPFSIGGLPWNGILIRTSNDPSRLLNVIRLEYAAIDKELYMFGSVLGDELTAAWYTEPRFVMTMLAAFASLGLVLVSVGVYSVLSYAVSRRTQEIGIRMALGAQATDVRRMVMMSGLRWLAIGIGIGIPASIALAKVLQNRIWGIKSADPLTLIAVSLLLIAVGLAACYFPARRATRVDPLIVLRYE